MKKHFVYVLVSQKNGRIYIGQTASLEKRILVHNQGFCRSTKPHRPWALGYHETVGSRSQAVIRERYLKSTAGRKFLRTIL
ncbi:MAG: GIY-YIG nuclease family protein [Candidatus Omnitrophota bacterium]